MADFNAGANLNAVPLPQKQTVQSNYIDFTAAGTAGWAQQYLPDLMESEAEVFGNRTVAGFLEKVGAEEAMSADQVIWSEQGRLHLSYNGTAGANNVMTITTDVDGNLADNSTGAGYHGIRVGDTVILASATVTEKCYVSAVGSYATSPDATITVAPYGAADSAITSGAVSIFVYGSEFKKGTEGRIGANKPVFKSYANKPIILKDKYEISGSDASQIGWVEVSGEEGQNGYLWYLKAAGDTKARFTDYCEMSLIEAEKAAAASTAGVEGTEGLFAAIEDRGNIAFEDLSLTEFDRYLREFDKQGAIEENMMFLDRTSALAVDDMLGSLGGTSTAAGVNTVGGGSSYGVFDNDANMALNLGFSGFRRGSYDFYKTDWKYLNDKATRGGVIDAATGTDANGLGAIKGLVVPAGVSTVYDQNLGKNMKRPFLHVRYRSSGMENRKFKTWTTGSVGAVTSDLDAMEMHMLTERCLVVQGANNFMLLKG